MPETSATRLVWTNFVVVGLVESLHALAKALASVMSPISETAAQRDH